MSDQVVDRREYRLAPRDREGVMFGLGLVQIAILGVGCGVGVVMLIAGFSVVVPAVIAALAAGLVYGRWDGVGFIDWAGPLWYWRSQPTEWETDEPWDGHKGDLPPCMAGVTLRTNRWDIGEAAVVSDWTFGRHSVVVAVEGRDFALLESDDKEGLLDGWGRVLAAHAVDGTPVAAISWTEIANRASLDHHVRWMEQTGGRGELSDQYRELIRASEPRTTRHETFLTVTIEHSRLKGKQTPDAIAEALRQAAASTLNTMAAGGLERCRILNEVELMALLWSCVDPISASGDATSSGGLSQRLNLTGAKNRGPAQTYLAFAWWETDGCAHVTLVVEDWPRFAINPGWLTEMLGTGRWARRMTVVFEPVPMSDALDRIEKQAFQLDSSAMQREESGRRLGASWRKTREALDSREDEIVSGSPQMRYAALVTVSAKSGSELDDAVEGIANSARSAGIRLRVMCGQQDQGWAASLPLGLGIGRRIE